MVNVGFHRSRPPTDAGSRTNAESFWPLLIRLSNDNFYIAPKRRHLLQVSCHKLNSVGVTR